MNDFTSGQKEPKPEIRLTKDGSSTLFSQRFNQHYHNPNGAIGENEHVFFKANNLYKALSSARKVRILEIGFGTGLNLLLLLDALLTRKSNTIIRYHSIEAFPISAKQFKELNYGKHLQNPELADKVERLLAGLSEGANRTEIIPKVLVNIFYDFFNAYQPSGFKADYIFHDAFSPEVNPELWSGETFRKLAACASPNGILTTYCAASGARAAMCWAGWNVASAPGALGKREMTIAALKPELLEGFERLNEKRLAARYEAGDFKN